jgi:hypothetical protein
MNKEQWKRTMLVLIKTWDETYPPEEDKSFWTKGDVVCTVNFASLSFRFTKRSGPNYYR